MTIAARQYSSGAEIVANANALRRKLMNPPSAVQKRLPKPEVTVINFVAVPAWKQSLVEFDAHVRTWREYRVTSQMNRYKEYIVRRCKELGANYAEIVGPSVQRTLTGPRGLIMYEMKTKLGCSYPRIAREFNRDHTTVVAAVRRITKIRGEGYPENMNSQERLLHDRELNAALRKDYVLGLSVEEMSVKYDIPHRSISEVIQIENWPHDPRARESVAVSKSVKVNIAEMRREYQSGQTIVRIAAFHGVTERTVRTLAKNNGWTRKAKE